MYRRLPWLAGLLWLLAAPSAAQPVPCERGRAAGYPCRSVDLLAHLSITRLGGGPQTRLNDIWGWTDPETGREYALVGRSTGTSFVDVTDPARPVYVGSLELTPGARPSSWRDVKVYADHAYVVADAAGAHGMQVFDLRQLRGVTETPVRFDETARYTAIHSAHNVAIDEASGFAYVVGAAQGGVTCGGGLHIVDLREPTEPAFAGCAFDAGYVHDAQCVVYHGPDADYRGRQICIASAEQEVAVFDVTDKAAPLLVSTATYPDARYVHQGWLTEDHRYFFQDDELDEQGRVVPRTRTLVWDLADLDQPVLLASHLGTTGAIDHNQYVAGHFVYQANYRSGLRVLDIRDVARPVEVAYFDTYPADDAPSFEGAWSVYPFFESRTLVVSSIHEGLFVLRLAPLLNAEIDGFTAAPHADGLRFSWQLRPATPAARFELEEHTADRPGYPEWTAVATLAAGAAPPSGAFALDLPAVFPGTHTYRLKAVDASGTVLYGPPLAVTVDVPGAYALAAPYPNPFRDRVHLTLSLREAQRVRVDLYDLLGRRLGTLFDGPLPAGPVHALTLTPPGGLGSGTYVLRAAGETFAAAHPVVRRD